MQQIFQFAVKVVVGRITNQEPHQRLGDRRVDVVHRHVVRIVSTPAERLFAHVTRTEHKPTTHQQHRADPRLDIFKRQIACSGCDFLQRFLKRIDGCVFIDRNAQRRMFDAAIGVQTQTTNINCLFCDSGRFDQQISACFGVIAGAKTWHRHTVDISAFAANRIQRPQRD